MKEDSDKPLPAPPQTGDSKRWRAVLAYDGRPFQGWQLLPHAPTVQGALEQAIARITKKSGRTPVHASGRTDSGVHALGQVIHWNAPAHLRMDGGNWMRALNANLPPGIRVLGVRAVTSDFHARFSATGKHYQYKIFTGEVLLPHDHGLAWHLPPHIRLDVPAMRDAAAIFLGDHDFSAFAAYRSDSTDAAPGSGGNIRTITRADITTDGPWIHLDIEGAGFLYRMVRMMVGALSHIGRGTLDQNGLRELLACRVHRAGELVKSPLCAPANGLILVRVDYED